MMICIWASLSRDTEYIRFSLEYKSFYS